MNYLKLCEEKLDVNAINDLVGDSSCGAISMFIGTTRDNFEDKKVLNLQYEAYEPMALKTMNQICENMRSKWPDIKNIAIYHRLGNVPVKEASVIIAISSPHRQTSLLSVEYAIDELKKNVPIWKKEQYENNGATWKENNECTKIKRPKIDFDACTIDKSLIPKNLIQISADENEVSRRIQCFIEKKREEIDLNNVLDFTNVKLENLNEEETCARVNSIVIKQKDSKGYLKVQRVKNEYGPQTKVNYITTLDKLMIDNQNIENVKIKQELSESNDIAVPFGVAERLENVEKYLNINTKSMKSIYDRIKSIENRILFLETISPEYRHFLDPNAAIITTINKKTYSIEDLDVQIQKLKESISSS